jgi:hypothetical protein
VLEAGNVNLIGRYFNSTITEPDLALAPGSNKRTAAADRVRNLAANNGVLTCYDSRGVAKPCSTPAPPPPPPPPPVPLPNRMVSVYFECVTLQGPLCAYKADFWYFDINSVGKLRQKLTSRPDFQEYLAIIKVISPASGIPNWPSESNFAVQNAFYNQTFVPGRFMSVTLMRDRAEFDIRSESPSELPAYEYSTKYWVKMKSLKPNKNAPFTLNQLQFVINTRPAYQTGIIEIINRAEHEALQNGYRGRQPVWLNMPPG